MTPDAATGNAPGRLQHLSRRLAAVAGWRRYALAFALGAVTTLTLPPVSFFPLGFLTFPALLWLLDGAPCRRAAFVLGWWFGLGYFAIGLYWIGNALLVFAAKYAFLLPFAGAGLPVMASASFSPIIIDGALVLLLTTLGMIEASTTRSPSSP